MRLDHLGTLLDLAGIARPDGERFDANETAILNRQLEYVKQRTFEIIYPSLKARQFIPLDTPAPAGAETIAYDEFDKVFQAKVIANFADDLPEVDVFKTRVIAGVHWLGSSYSYSVRDIQAAAFSNVTLPQRRAAACRESIERLMDQILATGHVSGGLTGFLNHASIPITAVVTGTWTTATAAQILGDIRAALNAIFNTTNGEYQADTLLIPTNRFTFLAATQFSAASDKTVLAWLQENLRAFGVTTIDHWWRLNTAGAAGATRMVAYKKDPDVLNANIPVEYTELPPQPKNLAFRIPAYAKIAGLELHQAGACTYMDTV